jgi:hypothetical protein
VPAIVVDEFPGEKRFVKGGVPFIPCPNETRGRTCTECQLCLDDKALKARGVGIAFAVHGSPAGKHRARGALVQLGRR